MPMPATVVLPLTHVPPGVVLVSEEVVPTQIARLPVIGAGNALIVTTEVIEQPPTKVKVKVAVPVVAPVVVTTPLEEPMVISPDAVLHVPPEGKPLSVVVPPPAHAVVMPVTDVGIAFTVSADTVVQPSVVV